MDLILGGFYSSECGTLSQKSSTDFEKLLLADDYEILEWLFQKKPVPQKFANIINKIREFKNI